MNPVFLLVQAICLSLVCAILGVTPAHWEALILALLLAGLWLALDALYAAALKGRRRSPGRVRSDRRVRRQVLLAVAVGVGAGGMGGHLRGIWLWHDDELLSICFGALAALAWVVYASSLVDWYYVRPRLDGVVRNPPCLSSGEQVWGNVTRIWYLHRALAELLGIVAVIAAFTTLVCVLLTRGGSLPPAAVVAVAGGAAGALLLLTQRAVATLRHQVLDEPGVWIGDVLHDGEDGLAYVLHVTIRGVVVRDFDAERGTWGRPRQITHDRFDEQRLRRSAFGGCGACSKMNPRCEWVATDRDAGLSPRRLLV